MVKGRPVEILLTIGLTLSVAMPAAGQTGELYSFRETERTDNSSRIVYESTLSQLSQQASARRLMCDSASLALARDFKYFRARPSRQDRSATLEFFAEPPRRSFVVTEDVRPDADQDSRRVVIDASWLAGACEAELAARQAEVELDPNTLQEIRVRAETISLDQVSDSSSGEGNEIVCVTEPSLDSRIPKRRCNTRAELDRIAAAGREWFRTEGTQGGMVEVNTID